MALIWTESFPETDLLRIFNNVYDRIDLSDNVLAYASENDGRNNKPSLNFTYYSTAGSPAVRKFLRQSFETIYIGFAIKFGGTGHRISNTAHSTHVQTRLLVFEDASTEMQACINRDMNNLLHFHRLSGNATFTQNLLGVSENPILPDIWHYIEVKYTPSDSCPPDSNIVRLNGQEIINIPAGTRTNNNTASERSSSINTLRIHPANVQIGHIVSYCDIYVDDSEFLGNVSVDPYFPIEIGSINEWGTDVSEINSIDDDTFTQVLESNKSSLFKFGQLPSNVSDIKGINLKTYPRKSKTGVSKINSLINNHLSPDYYVTDLAYPHDFPLSLNPDTNQPWTREQINNAQFGFRS